MVTKNGRTMKIRMAAALTVVALMAGAATAQVSGQGGPVQVGSDSQRIDQQANTMYLDGRVEILQDKARLRTDRATIIYSQAGGDINRIEATGNIYYVTVDAQGQQTIMKGDNAVYTKADDTMVVTGNVILQQGQNVSTGNRLVSQVSKGITTFTANPGGQTKGRVRSVLYPSNKPGQ
jgi:lipopolysaccharide export system protein LptA